MPGSQHGPSIKNPRVYDALRRKGMSKRRAAAISNAQRRKESGVAGLAIPPTGPHALFNNPGVGIRSARRRKRLKGWNAKVGQTIVGNLVRGEGGRFASSGQSASRSTEAQRKRREETRAKRQARADERRVAQEAEQAQEDATRAEEDAYIAAGATGRERQRRRAEIAAKRRERAAQRREKRRQEAETERQTRQQEDEQEAKTRETEQAEAESGKGKGGSGGKGKKTDEEKKTEAEQKKAENRKKTASQAGLSEEEVEFLAGAASGTLPEGSFDASHLRELGLVEDTGDTTEATDAGRRLLAALEKGDVRAALAAIQDGKAKVKRDRERAEAKKKQEEAAKKREAEKRQREEDRQKKKPSGDQGPTKPPVSTMPVERTDPAAERERNRTLAQQIIRNLEERRQRRRRKGYDVRLQVNRQPQGSFTGVPARNTDALRPVSRILKPTLHRGQYPSIDTSVVGLVAARTKGDLSNLDLSISAPRKEITSGGRHTDGNVAVAAQRRLAVSTYRNKSSDQTVGHRTDGRVGATRHGSLPRQSHRLGRSYTPPEESIPPFFTVYKDLDGRDRWAAITTTAYQDKDQEWISRKAIRAVVAAGDSGAPRGPLRFWHVPGLDLGDCDYQAALGDGRMLLESGTFRSKAAAKIGQEAARRGYQMSPGFVHTRNEPRGGVFDSIALFERSFVPPGRASNPYTRLLTKERRMLTKEKREEFEALAGDTEGRALLQQLLSQAETTTKAADQAGAVYKDAPPWAQALVAEVQTLNERVKAVETKAPMPPEEMVEAGATEMADGVEELAEETMEEPASDLLDDEGFADLIVSKLVSVLGPLLELEKKMAGWAGEIKAALPQMTQQTAKDDARAREIADLRERLKTLEGDQPRAARTSMHAQVWEAIAGIPVTKEQAAALATQQTNQPPAGLSGPIEIAAHKALWGDS